jgi:hypothetical protein
MGGCGIDGSLRSAPLKNSFGTACSVSESFLSSTICRILSTVDEHARKPAAHDGLRSPHRDVRVIAPRHVRSRWRAPPFIYHALTRIPRICRSVYVRNLEERVKPEQLKSTLEAVFSEYGTVIDIVAKTNLKAKGQAFVVFDKPESAQAAINEVQGFEVFDKPMQLALARTRSDATVKSTGSEEEFVVFKRRREAEKGMLLRGSALARHHDWILIVCFVVQTRRKPSKPRSRNVSSDHIPQLQPRIPTRDLRRQRAEQDSKPLEPAPVLWCPTSICLPTRSFSYRICQKTLLRTLLPTSLAGLRASGKCALCLVVAASHSSSTKQSKARSLRRRTLLACRMATRS